MESLAQTPLNPLREPFHGLRWTPDPQRTELADMIKALILTGILLCSTTLHAQTSIQDGRMVSFEADLAEGKLALYWKNESEKLLRSLATLKSYLDAQDQELLFAMNAGMYLKNRQPQGLYIEKGDVLVEMDTLQKAFGNFYLQPNGVFFLTREGRAGVKRSDQIPALSELEFATQSGPMLLIEGKVHSAFRKGSENVHIRNGVGILPNGNPVFAISSERVNLYDFASFFQSLGCENALYLDGYVSRMYLPSEGWNQLDGNFGAMIGYSSPRK